MKLCKKLLQHCPDSVYLELLRTVETLIICEHVTRFYVGTHGRFDYLSKMAVEEIRKLYPFVKVHVVLAYMTQKQVTENTKYIRKELNQYQDAMPLYGEISG